MSGGYEGIGLDGDRDPRRALIWRRKEKSLHHLIWIGIAITSIGFIIATAWMALQSRSRAIGAATASVQNLALVLDKHIARTVDAVDTLLQTALHEGADRSASLAQPSHIALLTELTKDLPYVKTIELMSERGAPLFSLRETSEAGDGINLETYVAYNESPQLGLYVSRPRRDGASRTWLMGIARRGPQGSSAAGLIAVVHIDIEQLQHLFEEIDVGRTGALALWRADGMLLTRKPYEGSNVGRTFRNATLFQEVARSPAGVYEPRISITDGLQRLVAYRSLPATSLIIAVALGKDEVLASWRRDLLRDMAVVGVVITILVSFGVLIGREAQRRGAAEVRAKQKTRILEATLENMDQGLVMYDADARVQVCNRRAMELLDLPASLMLSQPTFEEIRRYQIANGEFALPEQDTREWVRSMKYERTLPSYERERPNGTVLEIRTVPIIDGGAVRTFTDITARKQVEKRIAHMARHDALTGLPNRILFRERIEEALGEVSGRGKTLAILCLDLDQFKTVNDTLGHPVGDVLLNGVAERIKSFLSEDDMVARLGGDEFAILQVGAEQPQDANMLAQCLVEGMRDPFLLEGHKLNIGVSIGIALAPSDGLDVDLLLKCADLALYRAKAEGRDTFRFFEPAMGMEIQVRREIETDMREALAKGEFQLHYQPFMSIARGEVVGFEALLRWNHPSRGFIPPSEFIPIAEETGLILQLGEWVIRQACTEAAQFPDTIRVAVNVSAVQFRNPLFPHFVVSALAASGLSPHRLELEITETVLMQSNMTVKTLHHLRALGIRIALDDFGTGYSSLSYLSSFPFDKLKIDRSFVKELGTNGHCASIVRAIISLGTSLGMVTTAEGVETAEQLEFLAHEGCTEAQGYLVNTPKPIEEAVKILPPRRAAAVA